jgi:Family of unknown function (DUF6459)
MSPLSPTITRLEFEPPTSPVRPPDQVTSLWFNPLPAPLPYDPAVLEYATQTMRFVLEVLGRRRPLAQIAPLLSPQVRRYLDAHLQAGGPARRPAPVLIGPVHMFQPHHAGAEIAATYRRGRRAGALAARFDLSVADRPWLLSALRIG